MASTTFRRASEQTRAPLVFGLDITFSFFLEAVLPRLSVPDLCRPSALPSLFMRLLARGTMPTMSSVVFLPQILQSHRSRGFLQILLRKDRHTYTQTFSVIVQNFEARGNVPFFPHDSAINDAESLLIPN